MKFLCLDTFSSLPECIFVYVLLLVVEVLVDVASVLLSLPLDDLVRLARRQVSAQNLPDSGSECWRDSRPRKFLQLLEVDRRSPRERTQTRNFASDLLSSPPNYRESKYSCTCQNDHIKMKKLSNMVQDQMFGLSNRIKRLSNLNFLSESLS